MSRSINTSKIDEEGLSYEDAKYLQDRNLLPKGYTMPDPPERDVEEPTPPPSRVTPLEEQNQPKIERKGGIVDDDEEELYEAGWNNDQRRAKLSEQGLSVNGNKEELIGRLRRADTGALLDDDYSEV